MAIVRNSLGTIAAIIAAQAIVAAADGLSAALYPVNDDIASLDPAQIAAWVASVPFEAKLILVCGWALAAFVGPWLALRITDWRWSGWIVTAMFFAAGLANQAMLPHPLWMLVAAVLLPPAGGWLAQRLHSRPYPGEPLLG